MISLKFLLHDHGCCLLNSLFFFMEFVAGPGEGPPEANSTKCSLVLLLLWKHPRLMLKHTQNRNFHGESRTTNQENLREWRDNEIYFLQTKWEIQWKCSAATRMKRGRNKEYRNSVSNQRMRSLYAIGFLPMLPSKGRFLMVSNKPLSDVCRRHKTVVFEALINDPICSSSQNVTDGIWRSRPLYDVNCDLLYSCNQRFEEERVSSAYLVLNPERMELDLAFRSTLKVLGLIWPLIRTLPLVLRSCNPPLTLARLHLLTAMGSNPSYQ